MMSGYGWCVLRANAPFARDDTRDVEVLDDLHDEADERLWSDFRRWFEERDAAFLKLNFHERNNNERGVLTFSTSRNHRASLLWEMLDWIIENGPGSYGLVYVHDDEDQLGTTTFGRGEADFSTVFRVHRVLNGVLTELDDPFFGDLTQTVIRP